MTDELLAYLMDDLSPECRAKVERNLEQDPAWREELQRLEGCLAANGDPCPYVEEPPCDLVVRTCFLVEHAGQCEECAEDEAEPAAPRRPVACALTSSAATAIVGGRWSLADWAVGGGALLLLGCLFAPALVESRNAARGLICQDNLRWLGSQLFSYQRRQPNHELPPVLPGEHAGMFAVRLADWGIDREELAQRMLCPNTALAAAVCSGRVRWELPTGQELAKASGPERTRLVSTPAGSYAFRWGRYDDRDNFHLPRFVGSNMPLLADEPDFSRSDWGSSNHAGGQFVLYEDMSAPFRTNCLRAGGSDNIFRNAAGDHAAPCSPEDTVLGHPRRTPMGPIVPVSLNR